MFAETPPAPPITMTTAAAAPLTTLRAFISPLPLFRSEPVAQAANGLNEPRTPILLELLADARDVNFERVRFGPRRYRPHRLRQLSVGHQLSAAAHQRGQDSKLDPGQRQAVAGPGGDTLGQVDHHVGGGKPRATLAAMPADDRLNTRDELFE